MKKINYFLILTFTIFFNSCSTTSVVKSNGVTVASGTEVPYNKISNESFAENYIGADVIVNCAFLSSQSTAGYTTKKPPKNHFAFRVTNPDVQPSKNELTGALVGLVVFAPMEYSDFVFGLKAGDKLQLRGGTLVTKIALIDNRYVHFKATKIEKK